MMNSSYYILIGHIDLHQVLKPDKDRCDRSKFYHRCLLAVLILITLLSKLYCQTKVLLRYYSIFIFDECGTNKID